MEHEWHDLKQEHSFRRCPLLDCARARKRQEHVQVSKASGMISFKVVPATACHFAINAQVVAKAAFMRPSTVPRARAMTMGRGKAGLSRWQTVHRTPVMLGVAWCCFPVRCLRVTSLGPARNKSFVARNLLCAL